MPSQRATMRTREEAVRIPLGTGALQGDLSIPVDAAGLVIFAHGSGSGRFSTRNRAVAGTLQRGGLATLLLDLLTLEEERIDSTTSALRFDIPLLSDRVARAVQWARAHESARGLAIGLFGASTGAAAALVAAARTPGVVRAVVSRGGRPDLAADALADVRAPTLLIVGGYDTTVLELNRAAQRRLSCESQLQVVPRATHLFEEPGALEQVSALALDWFLAHLTSSRP